MLARLAFTTANAATDQGDGSEEAGVPGVDEDAKLLALLEWFVGGFHVGCFDMDFSKAKLKKAMVAKSETYVTCNSWSLFA